jgi:hypothetical protein
VPGIPLPLLRLAQVRPHTDVFAVPVWTTNDTPLCESAPDEDLEADCQSAAGYQPAPRGSVVQAAFWVGRMGVGVFPADLDRARACLS